MVDLSALRHKFDDSGMTMVALANKTGIKRPTLVNRFNGVGEFSATEIMLVCNALHINRTERELIFFANKVEWKSTFGVGDEKRAKHNTRTC